MIRLVPMNETDFQAYLDFAIAEYAEEHIKAGRWSAEIALQEATRQYEELLPDGLETKDQYLFSIEDEELATKVGLLWFAVNKRASVPSVFVYDVMVFEEFRSRGYGKQAFQALEAKVREFEISTISLHVFGHNSVAINMYEKLGYVATNIMMSKKLDTQES